MPRRLPVTRIPHEWVRLEREGTTEGRTTEHECQFCARCGRLRSEAAERSSCDPAP